DEATALRTTVCGYDRNEADQALLATVELYRRWLDHTTIDRRHDAEKYAVEYLRRVVDTRGNPF
ncbi:MAG: hypothetical protein ACRDRB_21590, partial [Pseudonocardiaceae bacterium]